MSSIVISGDTSGSVTLQAPAIAGSTVVTLPTTSMNIGTGGGSVATNTAFGASALAANTTGASNTGLGYQSLTAVTSGTDNTAVGRYSLGATTTGSYNTAVGRLALSENTTASNNTAVGYQAGYSTTTAGRNTLVGQIAGYALTTGGANVVVGDNAFKAATTAENSVAIGTYALAGTTTGNFNTAVGGGAGEAITTGSKNSILGRYNGNQGGLDIRTSSNYIVLSDGDGNPRIYIAGTSGYFFPNIRSSADANNDLRFNTGNGELYYQTSSQRYKENIVDLEFDTSNLYNLRPVSYDDKATGNRCYGLIAEETFAQIPNVVVKRNIDGESLPDSIPYSMLSVVIINEMKKLKTLVDSQSALITTLTTRITALEAKVGA